MVSSRPCRLSSIATGSPRHSPDPIATLIASSSLLPGPFANVFSSAGRTPFTNQLVAASQKRDSKALLHPLLALRLPGSRGSVRVGMLQLFQDARDAGISIKRLILLTLRNAEADQIATLKGSITVAPDLR